nr:hypothetical protein [Bacteroidota bacterium]
MAVYDLDTFFVILDNENDIVFVRNVHKEGGVYSVWLGVNKEPVIIDCDEDTFTDRTAKGYLHDLGKTDLVNGMYSAPVMTTSMPQVIPKRPPDGKHMPTLPRYGATKSRQRKCGLPYL